jgi:hypothetical protein
VKREWISAIQIAQTLCDPQKQKGLDAMSSPGLAVLFFI